MGKVYVFDHPLIQHKVSMMRDVNTPVKEFRDLAREVSMLMGFEATRDLPLQEAMNPSLALNNLRLAVCRLMGKIPPVFGEGLFL